MAGFPALATTAAGRPFSGQDKRRLPVLPVGGRTGVLAGDPASPDMGGMFEIVHWTISHDQWVERCYNVDR